MEFELRSGTRVLAGGFTATKHLAKFSQVDFVAAKFSQANFAAAKFSLSLVRLSSNGHNFFVSASIRTPVKVLDSDFSSFKMIYSMYKMDSMKCSKCVLQLLPS